MTSRRTTKQVPAPKVPEVAPPSWRVLDLGRVIDATPALIAYCDANLVCRYINSTYEHWYQASRAKVIDRRFRDAFPAEVYLRVEPYLRRALAGETVSFETAGNYPDGQHRELRISYTPDIDGDGSVRGLTALLEDISELKRAQRLLERSQQTLSRAQHVARIGSWERDFVTGETWWSDQLYDVLGFDPQSVEGKASLYTTRIHPDDLPGYLIARDRAIGEGGTYEHEHRIVRMNGDIRHVVARAEIILNEYGRPDHQIGTVLDVTEARQMQERVQRSRERARRLTDALPSAIFFFSSNLRCRYLNARAEKMFHLRDRSVLGNTVEDIMGPAMFAKARDIFRHTLTEGEMVKREVEAPIADGEAKWFELRCYPQTEDDMEGRGFYLLVTDITEQRALERRVNHMEKLELVGQLTAGVSHEFNNLLGAIIGNLDLMEDFADHPEQVGRLINATRKAAARGAGLTDSLLAFSRRQVLTPKAMCLSDLIDELAVVLQPILNRHVDLDFDVTDDPWDVYADPSQLQSALLNLAINARDAMPDGGTLTVEVENVTIGEAFDDGDQKIAPGGFARIGVVDTGTGMAPEVLEKAVEPFFTTKPVGAGTGLGLSMVHGFAHQSGGFVRIDSTPDVGTRVDIYLPRAIEAHAAATDADGVTRRAIVMLRQPATRSWAVTGLRERGFEVLPVTGFKELHAILEDGGRLDLAVTDLSPASGEAGLAVIAGIREIRAGLRAILIGESDAILPDPAELHDLAVLRQPCTDTVLTAALDDLFGQPAEPASDAASSAPARPDEVV